MSSDADGGVRLWDVRMVQERLNIDAGPHAANKVCMGVWVYGCMCVCVCRYGCKYVFICTCVQQP